MQKSVSAWGRTTDFHTLVSNKHSGPSDGLVTTHLALVWHSYTQKHISHLLMLFKLQKLKFKTSCSDFTVKNDSGTSFQPSDTIESSASWEGLQIMVMDHKPLW